MTPRDRRYTRRIGTKPYSGTRYVEDGNVKIQYTVGGHRTRIVVGKNTPATRDLADQALEQAIAKVRANVFGIPQPTEVLTLAHLLTRYVEDAKIRPNPRTNTPMAAATLESYANNERAILRGLEGSRPADSIGRGEVREWINTLRRQHLAERTIAGHVGYLKQVYKWAVAEMELLDADPVANLKTPSRVSHAPAYSLEEYHRILRALDALPHHVWRTRVSGYLTALYGVRIHQALNLKWADLDFDAPYEMGDSVIIGTVTWRSDAPGAKRQPSRTLPIVPAVAEVLRDAWRWRSKGSPWVISNQRHPEDHSPYCSQNGLLRNLERHAGVEHIRGRAFHGLRRALATALIEWKGVSAASRWIGDTPEVLMRTYLKPTSDAERAAVRAIIEGIGGPKKPLNSHLGDDDDPPTSGTPGNTGGLGERATGIEPATSTLYKGTKPDETSGNTPRQGGQT